MKTDTPESDAAWESAWCEGECSNQYLLDVMQKLEKQRDAAWNTIKDIREIVIADETFGDTVELLFGKPLEEAEAEIARLNSLLNK